MKVCQKKRHLYGHLNSKGRFNRIISFRLLKKLSAGLPIIEKTIVHNIQEKKKSHYYRIIPDIVWISTI